MRRTSTSFEEYWRLERGVWSDEEEEKANSSVCCRVSRLLASLCDSGASPASSPCFVDQILRLASGLFEDLAKLDFAEFVPFVSFPSSLHFHFDPLR
jgi:hypothetical protein